MPRANLAPLCRGLNAALIAALKKKQWIDRASRWRLHLCMTATDAAIVAAADIARAAPWPGGIPRLKFPREAPSRSTLKLEEALFVLLDEGERERWLKPGMRAVDLGAAPGGWTWQLVHRSLHVTAVDNRTDGRGPARVRTGRSSARRRFSLSAGESGRLAGLRTWSNSRAASPS